MKNIMTLLAALVAVAIPLRAADSPFACNLGALSAAERKHHTELSAKLLGAVVNRKPTADGYAFRLDRTRISLSEVGEWIAMEQKCCPFFDFRLELGRENGPLTLSLGGREGVRKFIEAEFGEGA
jgi:hypothetical protein